MDIFIYILIFLYGIVFGSFLNVCIFRIPAKSSIVTGRSHCMNCNTQLRWYELIPIFSYIFLRGKCRTCKSHISIQYPIIEALNGFLYVLVFYIYGWGSLYSILISSINCFVISALLALSVIDFRTNTIPLGINIFIFVMGLAEVLVKILYFGLKREIVSEHLIGFFTVSLFLLIIFYVSKGRAIGGGDIKLMAAAGLLLGFKIILPAFFIGCILASVIHLIRMKVSKAGRELAFGPYLSAGIIVAIFFGKQMVQWYIHNFFLK